ncbi:hypothetical protein V6N13_094620 [Hibiscus sabdariffa]
MVYEVRINEVGFSDIVGRKHELSKTKVDNGSKHSSAESMMSSSSESSLSKVHAGDKVGRSQENDEALNVACFGNHYNNCNLPFELGRERSLGECELSGDNPKEGKVTVVKHAEKLMEEVSNVMV